MTAWSACPHVVGLADSDLARGALLLESVRPGTKLSDDPGGWSLDDVAPMLTELWQAHPADLDAALPKLSDRVDLVFDLARRRLRRSPAISERIGPAVLDHSQARAVELAKDGPVGLLHGDLHPGKLNAA